MRGFIDEVAGPPDVSPEELKELDREAMLRELEVLEDLPVNLILALSTTADSVLMETKN